MAKYKQYNQKLNELFADRTHWLRTAVKKIQGRPPRPTNSKINRAIIHLQDLASAILIRKIFKKEYDELDVQKNRWHAKKNKGRSREKKKSLLTHGSRIILPIEIMFMFFGRIINVNM